MPVDIHARTNTGQKRSSILGRVRTMARPTAQVLTLLGTPAVRRHPDHGRARRPPRRRTAHRAALREPSDRPRRAGRVGARPLRRVSARRRLSSAAAHAERRRSPGRAARPGRRPARRVGDGDRYGERDGRREDPSRPALADRGSAGRRTRIPRLHRRARTTSPRRRRVSCSPSPTRSATTGRSRSDTPRATVDAASARCIRTDWSTTLAGGTSPVPIRRSARIGPSGSTASRTRGRCPARSSRRPGSIPRSAFSPRWHGRRTGMR